ncbi:MAG: DNA polymerase I [Deinococcales bacterium]
MTQADLFATSEPENTTHPDEHGIPPQAEDPLPPTPRATGGVMPKRVVVIDGHALAYRSYYALARGSNRLQNSKGEPTHAIYGFMKTLLRHLREGLKKREGAVIVVFDPPVKTFRHEIYADYKAGRAETPEDLPKQIQRIKEIVDALCVTRLEVAGYEADDVIGTIATRAEAAGIDTYILTSDRDAYQLLSDKVRVISSDDTLVRPEDVHAKYGVTVAQWVDFRALTGDSSDNIPGAKGIGPKGAQKLLELNGSLQHILDNLESAEPKKEVQKVRDSLENVLFSQQLSRIVTNVPLELNLAAANQFMPNTEVLMPLLRDLEMNSILKEVQSLLELQGSNLNVPAEPIAEVKQRQLVRLEWDINKLENAIWGYELERPNEPLGSSILGLAAATPEGIMTAPEGYTPSGIINAAHAKALAVAAGAQTGDDPFLLAYVLDSNNFEPQSIAKRYLSEDWSSDPATQAAQAYDLMQLLRQAMPPELEALYTDLEKPVAQVLTQLETEGIRIDSAFFRELSNQFLERLSLIEATIHQLAGEVFNVNSRDQLETVLYDKLKLASGKKTKLTGKRSTAVSALEPLIEEHPIVAQILEYREIAKLRGTYLEPLPNMVNPKTGRLHTVFNQLGTATGRVSSINPNLQNIPVRTEIGREIRKGFIAKDGCQLLSADYSQIELRILAHITQEDNLVRSFQNNEDIHRATAAAILQIPLAEVTTDQRRGAKAINYGILYGMGAHRLSRDEGISHSEAKAFIEGYFAAYPGIKEYLETTKTHCREHGYVQDLFGRRRYIPDINAKVFNVREAAERAAINMPIQGTAAGIIKRAMIDLAPLLQPFGAKMLLQVHDELVLEVPEAVLAEVSSLVQQTMENAFPLSVPLGVGIGVGRSWYDAK